jgi:hypothetical protein
MNDNINNKLIMIEIVILEFYIGAPKLYNLYSDLGVIELLIIMT